MAALLLLLLLAASCRASSPGIIQPRPRIHVYRGVPANLAGPCHWFGCSELLKRINESKARS